MPGSYESNANDYNMVKKDKLVNFDASSEEIIPPYTYLGRKPIPITSSCQELLSELEECRGDIPFSSEVISRSAVDFTDNQRVLVNDVLEAACIESKYGLDGTFYAALVALGESLETRIKEEEKFYAAQKRICIEIIAILRQSSFPFSANQTACLYLMLTASYQLTGHPESNIDKEFTRELRDLLKLIHSDDHFKDPTPHRFFVSHTLHYYLNEMLIKVDKLANEETERGHPDFIHPHSEIDWASYLGIQLEALIDRSKVLTPREHFHFGMVEVYSRLVGIFRNSEINFSEIQWKCLKRIETRVKDLEENPPVEKHQRIMEACLEFMDELKYEGIAPEGGVDEKIRNISWDLIYLQPVATQHLTNFPTFANWVDNIIAQMMESFLELFPIQ